MSSMSTYLDARGGEEDENNVSRCEISAAIIDTVKKKREIRTVTCTYVPMFVSCSSIREKQAWEKGGRRH